MNIILAASSVLLVLAVAQKRVGAGIASALRWVSEAIDGFALQLEGAYGIKSSTSSSARFLSKRRSSSGEFSRPSSPKTPKSPRSSSGRGGKWTVASFLLLMLVVTTLVNFQLHPGDLHPSSRMLWSKRPAKNKHPAVAAKQVPKKNAAEVHLNKPILRETAGKSLILPIENKPEPELPEEVPGVVVEEVPWKEEEEEPEEAPEDAEGAANDAEDQGAEDSANGTSLYGHEDLTPEAFEQRVLLCRQVHNVAALVRKHFCRKGSEPLMEAVWTVPRGRNPQMPAVPPGMTALEVKAIQDMMVFFPQARVASARALFRSMQGESSGSVQEIDLDSAVQNQRALAASDDGQRMLLQEHHHAEGHQRNEEHHRQHHADKDHHQRQADSTPPAASSLSHFDLNVKQMYAFLNDGQRLISKVRQQAMQEGTDPDRRLFVHQGIQDEAHFPRMPPEILEILPKDDAEAYEGHKFRSCAVVGNSGVARMTAYGADIDGHDAVFRMNQAPASNGCQIYVGGRTTYRLINARWLHKFAHESMRHLPMEKNVTLVLTRYEKRNDIMRLIKYLERANRTDVKLRLMSQSTKGRSQKLLQYYRKYMTAFKGFRDGSGDAPSTGFLAVHAALQICDQVTVYAFGLWKQHVGRMAERQSMYHYFHSLYGGKQVDSASHAMDTERLLFDVMNQAGIINMCSFRSKNGSGEGWHSENMSKYFKRRDQRERAKNGQGGEEEEGNEEEEDDEEEEEN